MELERLFRSMAKRDRQPNMSFFAFTATPKHKTLAIFGRNGEASHRYTMRQAIEEGFIMDVLANYVTYKTYYRLIKVNAVLDQALVRFQGLQGREEEEAELWRGKTQAFRNLYAFLSQVIPYQDSNLEKLYTNY